MLAEIGADMIKAFYTGENFSQVVESTPAPIFVLGAEKTKKEVQALKLASEAVNAGARGVVFGRNVIQAKRPEVFIKALKEVVKKGADPWKIAQKYKLE
jgi:DhnA family fructose-bisphosphate aldolase class Ia